ncbi:MAG: c-type cytochrome [Bdellovibrionales bacterium]|nr:c-type cytochrome [Bdellovibrionales bacterium]
MGKKDELLDHDYDGIQEYDNDLPHWWVALFWGGIVFGFIYVGLYHFGGWQFASQKLSAEMKKIEDMKASTVAEAPPAATGEEVLLQLASRKESLEAGKEIFIAKCAACHLAEGQGLVGPNLTDDYWIHGGKITDIRNVVEVGVLDKGMIAWGPLLKAEEINQVTAYVWSLNGTNPPNPKEPQGELYKREGSVEAAESANESA